MKKILLALLLTGVLFVNGAEAVLINYDGTGFQYPTQILGYYSGLDGNPVHSSGFMWLDYAGYVDPIYGPHSLTAMAFAIDTNPVWVDWSQDVHNVSFWYGNQIDNLLSVQAYNDGVLAFDSGELPQNVNGMAQYALPDIGFDRLVFNGTPNYWTMDDFSWELGEGDGNPEPEPVIPEPMSMLLFGTGMAGLSALKRKKS